MGCRIPPRLVTLLAGVCVGTAAGQALPPVDGNARSRDTETRARGYGVIGAGERFHGLSRHLAAEGKEAPRLAGHLQAREPDVHLPGDPSRPAVGVHLRLSDRLVTSPPGASVAKADATSPAPATAAVPVIASAVPAPVRPSTSGSAAAPAAPASQRVVPLEVTVNGARSGTWPFVEYAGSLYASRDAFEEWRVQLDPAAKPIEFKGQRYWPLSAVPGFKARVDFATQSVELLFSPEAFSALRLTTEVSKRPVVSPVLPSVFLNYDFNYSPTVLRDAPSIRDLGVLAEIGVSGNWGVLTSSYVGRNLIGDVALGRSRNFLRLETMLTRDFPDQNRTLRLGDTATRAGMWGRNVYFGGVQYGTNFALTPDLVIQPLPTLTGLSVAPSTVELYINDVLRQVSSVPTGPFAIDNFPVMTGNGEARLVVRDLLGRETVLVQPFFTSSQLLAAGLNDWSLEAGNARLNLGNASNDYGAGFVSGFWRHGYSNALTLEGRATGTRQLRSLGLGLASELPAQLLGRAAVIVSDHSKLGRGSLWLLGLQREALNGSLFLEAKGSQANFRQMGQGEDVETERLQLAGNWTFYSGRAGSFGLGFANITRFEGPRISTVSANYSVNIGERSSISLTASHAVAGASGTAVGMSFVMPLDNNKALSVTTNNRDGAHDAYVAASRNPTTEDNFGWRALAGQVQNQARAEGGVYYQGRYGTVSGELSASPDRSTARLGTTGGLVLADGNLFATRRVDQSFAVAEVAGYGDVGIGLGSNVLTRTDASGVALIPQLWPYQKNSVRIDPRELPVSAEIDSIEQIVVPAWRSAVKVTFPVRSGRGALLKIALEDGDVAPAGAVAQVEGDKEEFYVARRGEAFVTGLQPTNRVLLKWKGRQCSFEVTLPAENPNEVPRLGPLLCKGVTR